MQRSFTAHDYHRCRGENFHYMPVRIVTTFFFLTFKPILAGDAKLSMETRMIQPPFSTTKDTSAFLFIQIILVLNSILIVADGLRTGLGSLTFPVIMQYVDGIYQRLKIDYKFSIHLIS